MAYGSAPRKVNGRWVTRRGRVLSAAGQRYWDNLHAQGRADAKGHYTTGIGGSSNVTVPHSKPKPAEFKPLTSSDRAKQKASEDYYRANPKALAAHQQALDAAHFGKQAKQAGFGPGVLDRAVSPLTRPLSQIGESAMYSPAGVYQSGRAVVKDVGSAAHGDPSFKRSRRLGAAMAKATAEDFRHPRRNAGYLALDIGAAVSAGAGGAARLGAAGKAAAETGRVGSVARALAHAPEPKPRTLRLGNLEAHPIESRNKARAYVQRGHDRLVNRAAERNPEGRIGRQYLPRKIGKTLAEERRMVAEPAARAPAGALAASGKKLTTPQQHALRMVAEQARGKAERPVTIGERHAFHLSQGDQRQAKITEAAARYLHDTPDGPKIRPEYTALRDVYDRLVSVAGSRDELLKSIGRLSDESAAERLAGPAQVIGGAKYETPTPGKLGKPSASLIGKRNRVERLQTVYDRAFERSKATNAKTRPATRGEATARLAELEAEHAKLVDDAAARLKGGVPFDAAETARRNRQRGRYDRQQQGVTRSGRASGASGAKELHRPKTLAQELRDEAQAQLDVLAERNAGEPWAKAYLAQRDEISRLRASLESSDPVFGDTPGAAVDLGQTKKYPNRSVYDPRVTRVGAALSVAKDELGSHEAAAAKRVKPTGLVGAEELKGAGEARIPYAKESAARAVLRPSGVGRGQTIGGVRSPGSLTHAFTGGLLRKGGGRQDTTRLVAESNVEAQRVGEALRVRDQIREAAVSHPPERGAKDYVAIRLDNPKAAAVSPRVRALIEDATRKRENGIKLSRAERAAMRDQHEHARQLVIFGSREQIAKLSPAEQEAFAKLYDEGKVGWVNRRLLGGLDQPDRVIGPGVHRITDVFDAINNAFRFTVLYLKPAYAIPNIIGNAALNLVQQGFASPANLARSARVNARLSADAAAKLDGMMGEGFVRAISGEGGAGRAVIDKAASIWSKGVDVPFRRSAFLYEARRTLRAAGMKPTWENVDKLLTDPALEQKLSEVVRRANKEIIDYGNLNATEREVVRRVVLFYPWVKGSTVYAGRFVLEHPIKAAAVAKLGQQGEQFALDTLGPVPSRYKGAFKAGGGLVNPASAAILGTPAQVVDATRGVIEGDVTDAAKLAEFASPAVSLGMAELSRTDPGTSYSYPAGANAFDIAFDQLVSSTPQASLIRNLKGKTTGVLRPTRNQALGKFVAGGLVPQNYDAETLAKAARSEQRSLLKPVQRVVADHAEMRSDFLAAAKSAGYLQNTDKLPAPLAGAITLRARRYSNYARQGIKSGDPNYQQRAYIADLELLRKLGKITPKELTDATANAKTGSKDDLERWRRWLGVHKFGGDILTDARAALKERGVSVDDPQSWAARTDAAAEFTRLLARARKAGVLTTSQLRRSHTWLQTAHTDDIAAAIEKLDKMIND